MRQIVSFGVAAALVASALGLAGYSVASAASETVWEATEYHDEPAAAPVHFEPSLKSQASCIAVDQILGVFALDVQHVGGEILALDGGLQQAFADSWRKSVGVPAVPVTQVFAHIVPGDGSAAVVDVVEIGDEGCAVSRTLLSVDHWLEILAPLKSVAV